MRNDLTEIVLVVDNSGSMQKCCADMVGGGRQYLEDQKNKDGDANVSLFSFNSRVKQDYLRKPIKESPQFNIVPGGYTALYDGIGIAINTIGQKLAETPEKDRPGLVLFVIITDGEENDSKEFTAQQVKDMIKHQEEKYNWQFTYLGANQDAFAVGSQLGLQNGKVANYDVSKAANAFDSVSNLTTHTRSLAFRGEQSSLSAASYSKEDRSSMV